jgi:hypothetical protein
MRTDTAAIFVGFCDVVGADSDQPAITNFHFAKELEKALRLTTILRTIATATEDEYHRMLPLQLGKLSTLCSVVRKLVVRKDGTRDYVGSHRELLQALLLNG